MIGTHGMPRGYLNILTGRAQRQSLAVTLHDATHLRRSDVYGRMYLYVCVKYFVLIIWWLKIFNNCIFYVANVGRSLAFIGRDGFYKSRAIFYRTG